MKNRPFIHRLRFALAGLLEGWKRERSFRTQVFLGVLVVIVVLVLGASLIWCAVVALAIALVLAAELLNSALEALIDHLHPDAHASIRVAKDMAAASVLLVSLGAAAVGLLLLLAMYPI
jgi:undecaprenol kinase